MMITCSKFVSELDHNLGGFNSLTKTWPEGQKASITRMKIF